MGLNMKDFIRKVKNMGKVLTLGVMDLNIQDNGQKIEFQEKELIPGQMVENMR